MSISADNRNVQSAEPSFLDELSEGMRPDLTTELTRFHDFLYAERNFSPHTVRAYTTDVGEFLRFVDRTQSQLAELDVKDLRSYFSERTGGGFKAETPDQRAVTGKARGRKLAPRSQARKLASVRAFFRFLERSGIVSLNPASGIPSPRFFRPLPGVLSPEEMNLLLEGPGESPEHLAARDRAMIEMLYSSGMRISELLSLKMDDVEGVPSHVRVTGKGNRERIVFLGESARSVLSAYLALRGRFSPVDDALFLNHRGRALDARGARHRLRRLQLEQGVSRRVHPHKFRHTFATDLLNSGADIRAVQEMLGHSSLSTTQLYTAVSKDRLREIHRQCHPHGK